jgi:TRAP-type C4-dicarboxylate transport system permease small subunit
MVWLRKTATSAEKAVNAVNRAASVLVITFLAGIAVLTTLDVILRLAFNSPISGSAEIAEYMMIFLALGMGWCALKGGHLRMELVVGRFSPRVQTIFDIVTYVISLGVYIIFTWRIAVLAPVLKEAHFVSAVLDIPAYPFYYVLSLGCAILSIAVVTLIVKAVVKVVKNEY